MARPAGSPHSTGTTSGLISEAGLPAVADPGAALVAAAQRIGVPVRPLAGASSLLLALAASGLNGQSFAFVGYLPQDAAAAARGCSELEALSRRCAQTQLLIETPYRNAALLAALLATLAAGHPAVGQLRPDAGRRLDAQRPRHRLAATAGADARPGAGGICLLAG